MLEIIERSYFWSWFRVAVIYTLAYEEELVEIANILRVFVFRLVAYCIK